MNISRSCHVCVWFSSSGETHWWMAFVWPLGSLLQLTKSISLYSYCLFFFFLSLSFSTSTSTITSTTTRHSLSVIRCAVLLMCLWLFVLLESLYTPAVVPCSSFDGRVENLFNPQWYFLDSGSFSLRQMSRSFLISYFFVLFCFFLISTATESNWKRSKGFDIRQLLTKDQLSTDSSSVL